MNRSYPGGVRYTTQIGHDSERDCLLGVALALREPGFASRCDLRTLQGPFVVESQYIGERYSA